MPTADAVRRGELGLSAFVRGQYPGQPLPKTALPGLRTVGFWNAVDQQSWGLDWHRNEGIEVTFLLHGQGVYEISAGHWTLNVGDVTVCPPWQLHRIGDPHVDVGTLMWFIIGTQIRRSDQVAELDHSFRRRQGQTPFVATLQSEPSLSPERKIRSDLERLHRIPSCSQAGW